MILRPLSVLRGDIVPSSCDSATLRTLITSSFLCSKRGKRVPPKNFPDVYLKGTRQFIERQLSDPYVKRRRIENYRCRSAFKLIEIDEKYKFLQPGSVVIDLGAAPGSWSQIVKERMGEEGGLVIAVDLLYFPKLEGVHSVTGNFTNPAVQRTIENLIQEHSTNITKKADVVLCDAAPKASGVKGMDHDMIIDLASSAVRFAFRNLNQDGALLFKLFNGEKAGKLIRKIEPYFDFVKSIKPDASRKESTEFFVLCVGYKFKSF